MPSKKAKLHWKNVYRGRVSPLPRDHFGHLDIRVGVIRDVVPNPNASHKYFITAVNFGEIFSEVFNAALVMQYEEEELIDRPVVCCCNIKPTWQKGFTHMNILVAFSTDDINKHELLIPPDGAEPGDRVTVPDFPPDPDTPFMDPNLGFWEAISDCIKVDNKGNLTYKDRNWIIEGKPGVVRVDNVINGFMRIV